MAKHVGRICPSLRVAATWAKQLQGHMKLHETSSLIFFGHLASSPVQAKRSACMLRFRVKLWGRFCHHTHVPAPRQIAECFEYRSFPTVSLPPRRMHESLGRFATTNTCEHGWPCRMAFTSEFQPRTVFLLVSADNYVLSRAHYGPA